MPIYQTEEQDALDAFPSRRAAANVQAPVVKITKTIVTDTTGLKFTVAEDVVRLFKVPIGWKFLCDKSEVEWEDVGTTGTLDVGHEAYGSVAANPDAFLDGEDIATAAGDAVIDLGGTLIEHEFTSEAWLTATLKTAASITNGKTLKFHLFFAAP